MLKFNFEYGVLDFTFGAHVYSVQVIDPFVTIEVFGIPADISQERTRTVPHNGKYIACYVFGSFSAFYSMAINQERQCFITFPNTEKRAENTTRSGVFLTTF